MFKHIEQWDRIESLKKDIYLSSPNSWQEWKIQWEEWSFQVVMLGQLDNHVKIMKSYPTSHHIQILIEN